MTLLAVSSHELVAVFFLGVVLGWVLRVLGEHRAVHVQLLQAREELAVLRRDNELLKQWRRP